MGTSNKNVMRVVLFAFVMLVLIGLLAVTLWQPQWLKNLIFSAGPQAAAVATVDLSSSNSFAVLAYASVVDANLSHITGDIGLSPASGSFIAVTCPEMTGTIYGVDAAYVGDGIHTSCFAGNPPLSNKTLADNAKLALAAAYTATANETPATTEVGSDNQLGSQTLDAGIYTFSAAATANIIGTLTLDGQGNPNAVFVFQTSSSLVTDSASVVHLINGAQACNVFWQVGSSATLGTGTTFVGTIMADQSITDNGGSTVNGRLLAKNASVTLNNTTITVPTCSAATTATLHVIKSVLNVGLGTSSPSDFLVHVKSATSTLDVVGSPAAGTATPGTSYTLSAGTYTISEVPNSSYTPYTQTFGGACAPNGSVTLAPGANKICTVINSDLPLVSAPASGGSYNAPLPLIAITKIPSPLALPSGPGPVTYTYTVKNIGPVAEHGVWVTDNDCSPVTFVSGNISNPSGNTNDNLLEPGDSWVYSCTKTVSQTVTNTAATHGQANGHDTWAFANATVAVGTSLPPPLIAITKVPSRLTPFPFGGGTIIYTYTVTNPGAVAMHDVLVTDDKCSSVSYASGDTNGDQMLNPGEVWTYTCSTNVQNSTLDVATAIGQANGLIATGYAFATVLVAASLAPPALPNTGLPPQKDTTPSAAPSIIPPSKNIISDSVLESLQGVDLGAQSQASPIHLTIPKINVDSELESVHLTPQGAVGAPETSMNAAWFNLSPTPGEKGSAIIVGHFGWKDGIPAVFDNLSKLQKGDKIYVEDAEGSTTAFVVREVQSYGENDDVSDVFNSSDGKAHLNLITCGGAWNAADKSYSDRVVVFADKAE